ncbi:hypothetical protein [Flavobacterium sp.]|uniref:hypothetical protein n=1 Tax=Flavobacterium sp. TaxID=239 RepID=UPI0039E65833
MTTTTQPTERDLQLLQDVTRFPNIFSQLAAEGENNEHKIAKINVGSYCGLVYLVMDILKASLLVLESDELPRTDLRDPNSNAASLIDLAIQLMPLEEIELLDILHEHRLGKGSTTD